MKETILFIFIVILLMSSSTMQIYAQNDTVKVEETVEDATDFNYQRKYKYLNKNLIEEKSLFKAGAKYILLTNNNSYFKYWLPALSVSYERKAGKCFSVLTQIKAYKSLDTTLTLDLGVQGKYYFLKKRELKNKVGANNFFGTYILFGLTDLISYRHTDKSEFEIQTTYIQISPNIQLGLGQQFAINRWMYFDFNLYGEYFFEGGFDFRIEGNLNFIIRWKRK